ncbi:MAG: flagellar assembly protein T N-terminal domain-containing protein, partial [Bacillota bacterium]
MKIFIILILLTLITPLTQAQEITVSAEAEIIAGVELARKEALQKAMVKSVRQAAGNFIRKSILVENSKLISSRIYSQAEGYISNYQILSQSAAAGVYKLEIKAEVTSKLSSDLEELKLIIENQTN